MTERNSLSLRFRLAVFFLFGSAVLFGLMGLYVYSTLSVQLSAQDDIALLGRIDRIKKIIETNDQSIDLLKNNPELYANMLGNKDNVLWIINQNAQTLIEVNPEGLPVPDIKDLSGPVLYTWSGTQPARMAWLQLDTGAHKLFLVAGKLLSERHRLMANFRIKLAMAWLVGVLLAFVVAWELVRRGLLPVYRLSQQAAAIGPKDLKLRLDTESQPAELKGLTQALNRMLMRLEEGYSRLSSFSEDLAHEMRTPLNNLMIQNQVAWSKELTPDACEQLLASQQEEYERLARMIENMLFLARAEKQDALQTIERVDLEKLSTQLADYFEGMADDRGMSIETKVRGEVMADPELLRRALANLLVNAIRYGFTNSVIVLCTEDSSSEWLDIQVINRGNRITPEHLTRIFDRFYRVDASRSNPDDTGGLGLAIVRSIMLLHHGEVLVDSTSAETRFTLRFYRHGSNRQ